MMKHKLSTWFAVPVAVWVALAPAVAPAKESAGSDLNKKLSEIFAAPDADKRLENESVRYIPGPERSLVQTPCYRFSDAQGRKVELTGAVHIAEKSYYDALNKHFEGFDAVLFEMVADPEKLEQRNAKPKGEKVAAEDLEKEEGLSKIYRIFAHDLLDLSLQAETIDYSRPNFIHADMSEKEFDALLKERGLTMDDLLSKKAAGLKIDMEQAAKLLPLMKVFVPKDDPKALMRMMAPMIAQMESAEEGEDKVFDELIIVRRNDRALEVLDKQLAAGKKNLSLFYGSGHFPDLRKRLIAKGWKEEGTEWRDAWVIPAKPAAAVATATPAPAPEDAKAKEAAPADPAAVQTLNEAFKPLAGAKTIRFTSTTTVNVDMLGQQQKQESVIEVKAARPNKLTVRVKNLEGEISTLTSDGTTVTLFAEGSKTYKQLPAPENFEKFAELPGLDEAHLGDVTSILPFLTVETDASKLEEDFKDLRSLAAADLDGKSHHRVETSFDGNRAVLWLDKQGGFPLVKVDIDAAKMLDDQLAELGEQAAAIKNMIKIDAAMKFSDAKLGEPLPDEAFRFVPAEGTSKE